MALHKSIGEIRALPYPEYRSWELFYMIEPWGFENDEYRTAVILAMLHNLNQVKKNKMKQPKEFMRDMQGEVLRRIQPRPDLSEYTREQIIELIKKDFGIR